MKAIKTNYALVLVMLAGVLAFIAVLVFTSKPARAAEMDNRIESSFTNTFVYRTYLKDEHIVVTSEDGVVILSGTVADETGKSMAQLTVQALAGVKSVDNQIEVSGDRPAANSDPWLRMKVRSALLFHRDVSASATQVYLKDGHITLKGEATSEAQKDLTAEYAMDVDGVKSVTNAMTVATPSLEFDHPLWEKIDDASITAQVKGSLLSHHSTSMLNTKVTTNDGIVTLAGTAKNGAEKDLVTRFATDIRGVRSVVNKMVIESTVSSNN